MAEFEAKKLIGQKTVIKVGETAVRVYDGNDPGESVELIDITAVSDGSKQYEAADLIDYDEFTLKLDDSDAGTAGITVPSELSMSITVNGATEHKFTAICTKRGPLAITRGGRREREFTFKKIIKTTAGA